MLVKPTGAPVPMEDSRKMITAVTEVPDTPYYARRLRSGELVEVVPARKLAAVPSPTTEEEAVARRAAAPPPAKGKE